MKLKEPKPFLKWAGGKKQIIDCIDSVLPPQLKTGEIDSYIEPFLGGGAVFFHIFNNYKKINNFYLSDINKDLILTYNVIKKEPNKLIEELSKFSEGFKDDKNSKEYFYRLREDFNEDFKDYVFESISDEQILRAARMIFLNRTCFNGLYRVNKSGKFNVPMGSYKNPKICDESNILSVSNALKRVTIECCDYFDSYKWINENSFVYLDPPYFPIKQNSFTSYTSEDFGINDHVNLSNFCHKIDKEKNAKFLLSNSNIKNSDKSIDFFEKTYKKLEFNKLNDIKIDARRSINSKGNKRGAVKELLIFNY